MTCEAGELGRRGRGKVERAAPELALSMTINFQTYQTDQEGR